MIKKSVKFEPMPGKVAVKTDENEETTLRRGNIILLSDPKSSRMGRVVAIYEPFNLDVDSENMTEAYVGMGDLVIFGKHTGTEVTIEGQTVIILRETEILTKVQILEEDTDANESQ